MKFKCCESNFPFLCNLSPLFVSLLKHVGMRRLLEINDDRKQYHHFSPLVHISLRSLDILKIFFARDISSKESPLLDRGGHNFDKSPSASRVDLTKLSKSKQKVIVSQ